MDSLHVRGLRSVIVVLCMVAVVSQAFVMAFDKTEDIVTSLRQQAGVTQDESAVLYNIIDRYRVEIESLLREFNKTNDYTVVEKELRSLQSGLEQEISDAVGDEKLARIKNSQLLTFSAD